MQETQWFVVANATNARVYSRTDDEPLKLVRTLEHVASRRKSSQLGDDKLASKAYEPRLDAHRKEHLHFAQEIAQWLEHEARAGAFSAVSLIAGSPFLGELKQQLGNSTTRLLGAVRDLDLSAVGTAELDRRVRQAIAQ